MNRESTTTWRRGLSWLCGTLVLLLAQFVMPSFAQTQTHPPVDPDVSADVDASYFGPFSSAALNQPSGKVNKNLVGPVQLLISGEIAADHKSIAIPLYRGRMHGSGKNVRYVLTDTTDERKRRGAGAELLGQACLRGGRPCGAQGVAEQGCRTDVLAR